jgi:transcriptional regulatory protein RtcR
MATLAPGGRISVETVEEEIARLRSGWQSRPTTQGETLIQRVLGVQRADELDQFERAQLACVLEVSQHARSLSEAGRILFGASRTRKKSTNDADRLRKYLARFEIEWSQINQILGGDKR